MYNPSYDANAPTYSVNASLPFKAPEWMWLTRASCAAQQGFFLINQQD